MNRQKASEEAEAQPEEEVPEAEMDEIRMARMAQLSDVEIDIDAKTSIGMSLAGALVLWRNRQIFR